ncbi:hypothetical protein G7Y89_g12479 [Cudoniella acicularis]|uniref:Uncharacterized protein n=1 Tax=Cudoniella acicularis TaxID=354080 RepID=A0A8H4RCI1_9HELO|nr:hypothetical protein G7Y89_g12479 [Cudoniella acicularis]
MRGLGLSAFRHHISANVECLSYSLQLFLILISNRLQKLGIHNGGSIEHRTRLTQTTKQCSRRSHSTPPTSSTFPLTLSTPFDYLTNSDTDADNADLRSARRWA